MKLIHRIFRAFDRGMVSFNREFDKTLNHAVRPRKLSNGRSFIDLAADELLTGPRKRRRPRR